MNFGFTKKAQFSCYPHNFSRGIQNRGLKSLGQRLGELMRKLTINVCAIENFFLGFALVKDTETEVRPVENVASWGDTFSHISEFNYVWTIHNFRYTQAGIKELLLPF